MTIKSYSPIVLAAMLAMAGQHYAVAAVLTFLPNFVVTESRTIGNVRYDVGYTGSGNNQVAVVATTPTAGDITTYTTVNVPLLGSTPAIFSFVTGIDASGNISVAAAYGIGVPFAHRMNVNTPGATTVTQMFANGIAGGNMFGGDGNFPSYLPAGADTVVQLTTPGGDQSGEVFDGRTNANGDLVLVGNGSNSGGLGLASWVNGNLISSHDCGLVYCYAAYLDPSASIALSGFGDEEIGLWEFGTNIFTAIPGINGRPAGLLTGSSDTIFYLNRADGYNLWTYNSVLGLNGRTGDVCAANPDLQCGPFLSTLLGMGKLNLTAADVALVDVAFRGSSYGDTIYNPGAADAMGVPEPAYGWLLVAAVAWLRVRRVGTRAVV